MVQKRWCSWGGCFALVSTWNIWRSRICWQATSDLFLWFFCSEKGCKVSRDCLSCWHRMQGGVQGARGEVTVWHLLVFIRDKVIPWHKAERLKPKQEQRWRPGTLSTSIGLNLRFFAFFLWKSIDQRWDLSNMICWLHLVCHSSLNSRDGADIVSCSGSGRVRLMRGCGSKVRCWRQGNNLTLSQVHFPWVYVVFDMSRTAACVYVSVCVWVFTLKHRNGGSCSVFREECKLWDQIHILTITQRDVWWATSLKFCFSNNHHVHLKAHTSVSAGARVRFFIVECFE